MAKTNRQQKASLLRLCRRLIRICGWHKATILADQDMYLQSIIDEVCRPSMDQETNPQPKSGAR